MNEILDFVPYSNSLSKLISDACEIAKNLKCDRNSECSGKNHHAVCDCNRGYERVEGRGCVRSQYIIRNDDDGTNI